MSVERPYSGFLMDVAQPASLRTMTEDSELQDSLFPFLPSFFDLKSKASEAYPSLFGAEHILAKMFGYWS